ncbi:hypothetical protein VB711_12400 [Cronbergia sp. UHCC 0137]|uniref:hypothetical protein n=1 Tax=Cronbergia sp. UHCC 0137 TaxID=3110239 RepID=UPI002B22091F|nr:hypothetical protein [Cronbergia sp. UHCC 0137]MEA5618631.1 hypothetical protein [Cronbergia sp. UHCC 0137]
MSKIKAEGNGVLDSLKIFFGVQIFMEVREIKICVDAEAAKLYESAILADRQKIDAILSLRLKELARKRRPLEEVMNDISRKAKARGLTLEMGI